MLNISDMQMRRAMFDLYIKAVREATERSIHVIEAMRDNELCTCTPDEFGLCPTCVEITKELVPTGSEVVELVELEEPPHHPNCGCGITEHSVDLDAIERPLASYREIVFDEPYDEDGEPQDANWPNLIGD